MKTLIINNEEFQAEKIIKTETNITGLGVKDNIIFEFKGISDFSMFALKDGETFDLAAPTMESLQAQIYNLTTQLINAGVL